MKYVVRNAIIKLGNTFLLYCLKEWYDQVDCQDGKRQNESENVRCLCLPDLMQVCVLAQCLY